MPAALGMGVRYLYIGRSLRYAGMMAGFKFNFDLQEDERRDVQETSSELLVKPEHPVSHCPSRREPIKWYHHVMVDHVHRSHTSYAVPGTDLVLKYVTADVIKSIGVPSITQKTKDSLKITSARDPEIAHAQCETALATNGADSITDSFRHLLELSDSSHTDLIPGVYEGGMKTWECAYDLVDYLAEVKFDLTGIKVLELGCGTGLPSIYALMKGARSISLQDYNPEVINFITIPSVLLNFSSNVTNGNCSSHEAVSLIHSESDPSMSNLKCISLVQERTSFFSGDWMQFTDLFLCKDSDDPAPRCQFDLILTSETIYTEACQSSLLSVMKSLLEPVNGCVLVAAKTYYFGVGGTSGNFEQLVISDGYFSIERVRTVDCAVPRVILRLRANRSAQLSM